jgi:hypothetical protein
VSVFRSFHFYDASNVPLTGLTPGLTYVVGGAVVAPLPVVEIGGGAYGVMVPDVDVAAGAILLVNGGATAYPRHQVRTAATNGLLVVLLLNMDGSLYSGAGTPSFGLYSDSGGPRTPPSFSQVLPLSPTPRALWKATATVGDIAAGTAARIVAPGDSLPSDYTGAMEAGIGSSPAGDPAVGNFSPALAAAVRKTDTISFDVTDALANLERVLVLVSYPNLNIYEMAHDGDSRGPRYANTFCSRVPITNGFRYTLLRDEGWPSSPRVIPMAFDVGGGVNLITGVIYGWTLVE